MSNTTDNYFFIDGSSLISQIKRLWENRPNYKNRPLILENFVAHVMNGHLYRPYHDNGFKRFVVYLPKGILDREKFIIISDRKRPTHGAHEGDIQIKECGIKLPHQDKLHEAKNYLIEKYPWASEYFGRAEKAVDTQICCDALRLAAFDKINRLFLLTNDRDFLPIMITLKDFGANVSIFNLSSETEIVSELREESDSYHYVEADAELDAIFGVSSQ